MKKLFSLSAFLLLAVIVLAQSPQKLSYQAIVRNAQGKLVSNANVGIRFSILQGSATGSVVYNETFSATTNVNGLVSVEIGTGTSSGSFGAINWALGPYFLKSETDPAGGTNYSISGISQFLSVPYALYSEKANVDGSETKIVAGTNISVTGTGTAASPYVIGNGIYPQNNKLIFTSSQTWTVPSSVSKIKVELWGASGGGGGGGAYTYSYSYILNNGGDGGSGGFAQEVMNVTQNQQFSITIGTGGNHGNNAYHSGSSWYGDTDGSTGGDSWFGNSLKAAGGSGGKRGSYAPATTHGNAGTANLGPVTGYAGVSNSNILDVWQGLDRSYIGDRVLTSKPGKGGAIQSYSSNTPPVAGEGGCAIVTFFE
jgi:hypothetical protein